MESEKNSGPTGSCVNAQRRASNTHTLRPARRDEPGNIAEKAKAERVARRRDEREKEKERKGGGVGGGIPGMPQPQQQPALPQIDQSIQVRLSLSEHPLGAGYPSIGLSVFPYFPPCFLSVFLSRLFSHSPCPWTVAAAAASCAAAAPAARHHCCRASLTLTSFSGLHPVVVCRARWWGTAPRARMLTRLERRHQQEAEVGA